jgi:hypothetical protein
MLRYFLYGIGILAAVVAAITAVVTIADRPWEERPNMTSTAANGIVVRWYAPQAIESGVREGFNVYVKTERNEVVVVGGAGGPILLNGRNLNIRDYQELDIRLKADGSVVTEETRVLKPKR